MLLLGAPVLLAMFVNPGRSQRCAAGQRNFGAGVALFAAYVWAEKRNIGKTVAGLLAGIVLVDLLAVQHVAPEVAAVFFGLFILAVAAQRWVPAT